MTPGSGEMRYSAGRDSNRPAAAGVMWPAPMSSASRLSDPGIAFADGGKVLSLDWESGRSEDRSALEKLLFMTALWQA